MSKTTYEVRNEAGKVIDTRKSNRHYAAAFVVTVADGFDAAIAYSRTVELAERQLRKWQKVIVPEWRNYRVLPVTVKGEQP